MGNYRQHLSFSTGLGFVYAAGAYVLGGVHWAYGSVAALLASVSGLLPDLDSQSGVGMRSFTGILGVVIAAGVWKGLDRLDPPPAFEYHLWAVVVCYVFVKHGFRRMVGKIAVHRGMNHSLPTGAVWAALTYLGYPSTDHTLRVFMAAAVMLGFLSHLVLDEYCSVDLRGARVNKAFGTALKLWAPSAWATLGVYALLSVLSWQVIQVWPDDPFRLTTPPPPVIPYARRMEELNDLVGRIERKTADRLGNSPLKPLVEGAEASPQAPAAPPADDPGPRRIAQAPPRSTPPRAPADDAPPAPPAPRKKTPAPGSASAPKAPAPVPPRIGASDRPRPPYNRPDRTGRAGPKLFQDR